MFKLITLLVIFVAVVKAHDQQKMPMPMPPPMPMPMPMPMPSKMNRVVRAASPDSIFPSPPGNGDMPKNFGFGEIPPPMDPKEWMKIPPKMASKITENFSNGRKRRSV